MRRLLKLDYRYLFFFIVSIAIPVHGFVGPVLPGQSLWCIDKRIAETSDSIESTVNIIESIVDTLTTSTTACPCAPTSVNSSDIQAGVITLSSPGNYCLAQDVTADIVINGDCISFDLNHRCVTGTISVSSDDVELYNGNVKPAAPTTTPSSSLVIASTSARVTVSNLIIENADSAGTGVDGRSGVEIYGDNIQLINSTVIAGSASDGTTGGTGGFGLAIGAGANDVIVTNCLFASGDGGESSDIGVAGGNAGDGIRIIGNATETEIVNCTILSTGLGGDGLGIGADGGDGGNGVFIESGVIDTVVRGCTIRNTGTGGVANGGTAGVDGKAAQDDVIIVANLSMFYQNFAHNIANSIKFALQGSPLEQGIAIANPPTATVVNPYANVYVS